MRKDGRYGCFQKSVNLAVVPSDPGDPAFHGTFTGCCAGCAVIDRRNTIDNIFNDFRFELLMRSNTVRKFNMQMPAADALQTPDHQEINLFRISAHDSAPPVAVDQFASAERANRFFQRDDGECGIILVAAEPIV